MSTLGMWTQRGGCGGDRCVHQNGYPALGGGGALEQVETQVEGNPLEVADVCGGQVFELLKAYGMGEWLDSTEEMAGRIRGDVRATNSKGGA